MAGWSNGMAGSGFPTQKIEVELPSFSGCSAHEVEEIVEKALGNLLWFCPRCGRLFSRKVMNGRYVCNDCWTKEDQNALDAKKEEVRKQLQEIDKELEEYHRNKLKDMI